MEGCQQRNSHVKLFPENFPKGAEKYSISIENNGHWEAIMFRNMFEEDLGSLLCFRSLLAWYEYNHLRKSIDYY